LGLGAAALLVAGCANNPKSTSGITALSGASRNVHSDANKGGEIRAQLKP
jgi:hypothetical protein